MIYTCIASIYQKNKIVKKIIDKITFLFKKINKFECNLEIVIKIYGIIYINQRKDGV